MKSLTAVCQTGASMPPIKPGGGGRVARYNRYAHPRQRNGENAEMKMYLSKLKDLVPFMPKNRKVSKLEIIQYVIDYICELQTELNINPEIGSEFDAVGALELNAAAQEGSDDEDSSMYEQLFSVLQPTEAEPIAASPAPRQPLSDRHQNTILPYTGSSSSSRTVQPATNAAPAGSGAAVSQQQQQTLSGVPPNREAH